MSYLQRAILTENGTEKMIYEAQSGELAVLAYQKKGIAEINRFMLSTDMYLDNMDRPLFQCDLVQIEGLTGTFIVEFNKAKFGFIVEKEKSDEWYYLHDVFDRITNFVGTFYDDKTAGVIGEHLVTL